MKQEQIRTEHRKMKQDEQRENAGTAAVQKNIPSEEMVEKKKLRAPRTRTYLNALKKVDDSTETEEIIVHMVESLPLNNKLLGILAGCKLPGCIIHAIDKEGNILEHYKTEDEIPEELQGGYQVFLQNKGCFSVEVYTLYYCAVYQDGSVKFYERNTESNGTQKN